MSISSATSRFGAECVTAPDEIAAAMRFEPFPEYDVALSLEMNPKIAMDEPADLADLDPTEFTPNAPPSLEGLNAEVKETRLYFGNDLFGTTLGGIEPWGTGEEPVLMIPRVPADPNMKQTAAVPAAATPGAAAAGTAAVCFMSESADARGVINTGSSPVPHGWIPPSVAPNRSLPK